jgi:hypothetical protein
VRKRYLYVLLFAVPIGLAATVAGFVVFGAAAGVIWVYVAGDNAWPPATDFILGGLFVLAFAATAGALGRAAYAEGRKREMEASGDGRAAGAAAAVTALLVLAIGAYQWRVGNIGPKQDGVLCSEFCGSRGYAGSSMPPRDSGDTTCSCVDAQGREAVRMPMDRIRSIQ